MIRPGDIVRFLDAVGGGKVTRIQGNLVYVEDSDGFETPVLATQVVVTTPAGNNRAIESVETKDSATGMSASPSKSNTNTTQAALEPFEETPEGEKLNIVLGYEPSDIKRLSNSVFDTFLVNDSNYFLLFTYMSQQSDTGKWTTRYAGRIEPSTQLLLGQLVPEELNQISRIAVQYIAFKDDDKPFDAKNPAKVVCRFDATKFFKLHCFRENVYFEQPVIAFDIVRDDRPCNEPVIDERRLQQAIREKTHIDRVQQISRPVKKHNSNRNEPLVVDLHIAELVDTTAGMSSADMLNLQVDKFRSVMDENLRHKGKKIVFIHGKGEGVLRQAILKELKNRYKGHDVQDASFREYGFGATQVTI